MKALQIPVTLFIHANVSQYTQEKISVFTMDMSQYPEYVLLETRTIHIDVNQPEPIDIIGKQVEALQLEKPVWPTPLTNALPRSTIRCSSCFALSTALSTPTKSHSKACPWISKPTT